MAGAPNKKRPNSALVMRLLTLMAVLYLCSIIAKSMNTVCHERPPTIGNLQRARISKCRLATDSVLYLGFFDFKEHAETVRRFEEWTEEVLEMEESSMNVTVKVEDTGGGEGGGWIVDWIM